MNGILLEGGNVFKTAEGPLTDRIATGDVEATVRFLEMITGLDFTAEKGDDQKPVKWLGTTGRKEDPDGTFELNSSGDLDLSVDEAEIDKPGLIARLTDWCTKNGVSNVNVMNTAKKRDGWIAMSGDSVHFRTPIRGNPDNGFVQSDFMFSKNPKFQQGSMIGGQGAYRGEHRHILLASIARARGLKYSPKFGLVDPTTGEPVAGGDDWPTIAKQLLGPGASVADIRSVPTIINFIKSSPSYEQLVAAARETLGKQGVTLPDAVAESRNDGGADWFRRLMNSVDPS
jgi:hypothetical protein